MSKNISVANMLEKANFNLARNISQDEKKGINFMVEAMLMVSDNYCGFCYLDMSKNPESRYYCVSANLMEDYQKFSDLRSSGNGVR